MSYLCVDVDGNFLGVFSERKIAPENSMQVNTPPEDGRQKWDGEKWYWPTDVLSIEARTKRNALLASSDWTQVADAPVDQAAWATYRQALRDITIQAGFPEQINWPEAP